MSELADAFRELLDANDEALGSAQTVSIEGTDYRALVEEITHEEIVVAGGYGQAGQFRATIPQVDDDGDPINRPNQGDAITVRDQALEILSVTDRNEVAWEILVGDSTTEDA
jgi:hypothetical protein